MYQLYWSPGTGAFAPQVLLEEAGIAYELVEIDYKAKAFRDPAYLAKNPMGQVPALGLPDRSVMTESAAMMLYLTDAHPEAGLAPAPGTPARAQFDRWLVFMAVNLYEADLRTYYAERYTTDPAGAAGVKAAGLAHMDRALDVLEQHALGTGPYFLGEAFSALDPYLAMLVYWHPDPKGALAQRPNIARLCATTVARPAIAKVWPVHYPESAA